jgi:serine/threonine protein kinase
MALEGLRLGRYRLLRLLGWGAMSEVYLAEDEHIEQQVAIKVLRAEDTTHSHDYQDGDIFHLFQSEAKAIAKLDHPHILPLYDYGEINVNGLQFFYLVMPLRLEGTLAQWLEQRGNLAQISPQDVAHFVRQAASALQHAHDHHIIHQDVKPSNFLLRRSEEHPNLPDLLLADFGLAKFMVATSNTIESGIIRGTPACMAPEQWRGNAERATDQYALGVMTYQMLTGRLPFLGTPEQLMYLHSNTQPQQPSALNRNLTTELDEVVLRALAKRPQDRFSSITAFARAFQQATQSMDESTVMNTSNTLGSKEITATLAISEAEALHGTNRSLVLPGGQHISVSIPPGISNGQVIRLEGEYQTGSDGNPTNTLILTVAVTRVEDEERTFLSNSDDLTLLGDFARESSRPAVIDRPRRSSRIRRVMLVVLAILMIVVTVELFFLARINRGGGINTANSIATSTGLAMTDPYTHSGKLELDDSLSDNSQGHSWQEGANTSGAACQFTGGAYHALEPQKGYIHPCFAQSTDFSNFVYEVQVTISTGDYGGIVFCADSTHLKFYYFSIGRDGHFYLSRFVDGNPTDAQVLSQGPAPFIHTNLNRVNLLAIVVQNGTIDLYVNQHKIGSYDDSTYTHGQIGVFAGNAGNSANIVFSDMKVWKL